jgi:hypothetical protein
VYAVYALIRLALDLAEERLLAGAERAALEPLERDSGSGAPA